MWFSSVPKEDLQSYLLIHARHEQAYWLASDLFAEVNSVSSKFKKNNSFREKEEKEINLLLENEKQIVRLGNITQPIARLTQDHVLRLTYLYELAADQALVGREAITREDSNLVSYEGMLDAEVKYIDQFWSTTEML